jgi:hypothetical protein
VAEANDDERPDHVTEVAIFHSAEAAYDRAYGASYPYLYLQGMRNFFMTYCGTPFHDYFLEDFDKVEIDFKVYIFPDASSLSSEQRKRIQARLQAAGATALWFYAPGYICDGEADPANLEALTGIKIKLRSDLRDYAQVDLVEADGFDVPTESFGSDIPYRFFQDKQEWLSWKLGENRDNYRFSPLFTVDDPEAETLGTLRAARAPGFARKKVGNMTSYYSVAPCPTPEIFQEIFRQAGVHLYSETQDIIYANARYVTFCANGDGQKVLKLPKAVELFDAFEDRKLSNATDSYTFEAKHGQVEIFRLGTPA